MNTKDQFQRVTQTRLKGLERKYTRLLWLVAFLVSFIVWLGLLPVQGTVGVGVQSFETLRSERFELIDSDGTVLGVWQVNNQQPTFILQTRDAGWRTILTITEDGGQLRLVGPDEDTLTILTTTLDGGQLRLVDPDQDITVYLRDIAR